MDYVFISHSSHDKGYARKLAQAIREHGFSVWLDDRIEGGERFPTEIERRIDDCAAFVLVVTPESSDSDWVSNELIHARDRKKKIVPLLLGGEGLPLAVKALQFVDVRGGVLPQPEFYQMLGRYVLRQPGGGEQSKRDQQERADALSRIRAAGDTAFACSSCGFPVSYDTITAPAMALLFGLPLVGGAVVYTLYHWIAAAVFTALSLAVLWGLLPAGEQFCREPSECPRCATSLRKPLATYG